MGLEKNYKNVSESMKILKLTIFIAFFLNLSTLNEWLQQKEVNSTTTTFLKLTQALNEIGNLLYLNSFRSGIRTLFIKDTSLVLSPNPSLAPVASDPGSNRKIAAIDPTAELAKLVEDPGDFDLIDDLVSEENLSEISSKNILVIGDSILKSGLQEHLERNLGKRDKGISIQIKSKSGTGLSRPDVFDWISYIEDTKEHFEKVVVFLGTNDAQNFVSDKKVIAFDSKEWKTEYALRVRKLVEKACSKAKQVYWVGSLRMKSDSFDAKIRSLQEVVRQEISGKPSCAQFVSVSNWFTRKTKYTDTWMTESKKSGKKTIKLRVSDGIHLTYWGADLFSQKLIESIYE